MPLRTITDMYPEDGLTVIAFFVTKTKIKF